LSMEKLTLSFCLREIANNIDAGSLYLRIGHYLLDYDPVCNEYVVHDKNGEKTQFVDLIEAINYFMGVVR